MMTRRLLCALLLAGLAGTVTASDKTDADKTAVPHRYSYLGGHVSGYFPYHEEIGSDFVEQVTLPGLQLGYRFSPTWSVQASWERNNARREESGRKLDVNNAWASLRHHLPDGNALQLEPYAGINLGELTFETPDDDNDETMLGIEAGVQKRVQPHWVLDVGFRIPRSLDNERFDLQAWVGLNHVFGADRKRRPPPALEEDTRPTLRDSDRDGVPDTLDDCPDTPAGSDVDDLGCP